MSRTSLFRALLSSSLAGWRGTQIHKSVKQSVVPRTTVQALHLYDMEGCPFCRLVREAVTELDLDLVIYPCPKGGKQFRTQLMSIGGKLQFPYLYDPNTKRGLYESTDIINYLFKTYGVIQRQAVASGSVLQDVKQPLPFNWRFPLLYKASAMASQWVLFGEGLYAIPAHKPARLLELYAFESSPYAKPVRERLCELEIPYVVRNLGKGGLMDYLLPTIRDRFLKGHYHPHTRNREKLLALTGRVASPYLIDPNTGIQLYESKMIIHYLDQAYRL